jgi:hypothetical protein
MKNNITIYITILLLAFGYKASAQTEEQKVKICTGMAGADATYLKDFLVELQAAQGNEKVPQAKYSILLNKDTRYRFTLCTDDDSPGKGIVQLFDTNALQASTFNPTTGKEFKGFDIDIQKTAVYHVFISFHDGKAGKATVIMSLVKRL